MKKTKIDVWKAQMSALIKAMRFSSLSEDTQSYVSNEMQFFNTRRIAVIAWVTLLLEALNMINVAFFSRSGLATTNNRQYFTMYTLMFVSGIICLLLHHLLKQKPKCFAKCCVGFTLFWILWHALLSSMDLRVNPNISVFITGIFGLSLLMRLKPWQTLCIMPTGLVMLLVFARENISKGVAINAAIVTVVAVLISCSRYFSTIEELGYRKKMIAQANRRVEEQQKIELLSKHQKALMNYCQQLIFIWDKEENTLTLSNGKNLWPQGKSSLQRWLANNTQEASGTLLLCMEGENTPCEYYIEATLQLDVNENPIGAIGTLALKQST